jgi:hypothetical protein
MRELRNMCRIIMEEFHRKSIQIEDKNLNSKMKLFLKEQNVRILTGFNVTEIGVCIKYQKS